MTILSTLILLLGPSVARVRPQDTGEERAPSGRPVSEGEQDKETKGDASKDKKAKDAMPDPRSLEKALDALIRPFLGGWKGKLASPKAKESLRTPLRALMGDIESWVGSNVREVGERRPVILAARDALAAGLAIELGGGGPRSEDPRALADSLVKGAVKEYTDFRTDRLERSIICWCPNENWTRTLAGCGEGCAEEQKKLVKDWVEEGCTDEEIMRRMEEHPKGGPRTRAVPLLTGTNWFAYVFPFLLFGAAVTLVAVVLRRVTGQRKPAGPHVSEAAPAALDPDWDQKIEEELKELER